MEALPNYGPEYGRRYHALFPELAKKNDAVLIPFLLEGVAGIPSLNQPDGIHPTAEGQRRGCGGVREGPRPPPARTRPGRAPPPPGRGPDKPCKTRTRAALAR